MFSSGSTSQSLASSNKESSILWRSLPEEERQKYNEDAKKKSGNLKEVNVKKECKKIVSHLQEMVYYICTCRCTLELFIDSHVHNNVYICRVNTPKSLKIVT